MADAVIAVSTETKRTTEYTWRETGGLNQGAVVVNAVARAIIATRLKSTIIGKATDTDLIAEAGMLLWTKMTDVPQRH